MSPGDDDFTPTPSPVAASIKSASPGAAGAGPGGYPGGGVPPGGGLVAPIFPTRDPSDPLSPDKLRANEANVQQSIALYDRLMRVARNAASEPGYRPVVASLVQSQALYRDLNNAAEIAYNHAVRIRDLTARLDMTKLENIRAYADAAQTADAALLTWKQVHATYLEIHQCLHRSTDTLNVATPESRQIADLAS